MLFDQRAPELRMPLRDRLRVASRKYPIFLETYWRWREHPLKAMRVTRRGDDAVIDGFPRSSNTFATHAFFHSQGDVKLGNHVHAPGQFVLAQRYGVPAMLVLRDPREATLSLSVFEENFTPALSYHWYVGFHRKMLDLEDFIVAPFEEVTSDFGRSIERLNERFGTSFKRYEASEQATEAVFARMARAREERMKALGGVYGDPMRIARPTAEKDEQKERMKKAFTNPELEPVKREAQDLYEQLMERAGS